MAKGDDIQERLIEFAVKIIKLCSSMPKTLTGKHISGQLLRSGTSPTYLIYNCQFTIINYQLFLPLTNSADT